MARKTRRERFQELFNEIKADEALAKREDAHWYGPRLKEAPQQALEDKGNAPAAGMTKDHGRQR